MYLSINDLKKGIYGEVLNVITRSDDNARQAIDEAQAEVASYLSARYDIDAEWQKTSESTDRLTMVVKLVREIALYNCYSISNPVNMPESRRNRYKDTIEFLRSVQAEKATIPGLQRLNVADGGQTSSSYILFGGNDKRNNQM
jgi:phage gp36-like protein